MAVVEQTASIHVKKYVPALVILVVIRVVLGIAPIIVAAHAIQPVPEPVTQLVPMPAREPVPVAVKTSAQVDVRAHVPDVRHAQAPVIQPVAADVQADVTVLATAVAHLIVRQRVLHIVLEAVQQRL
jgi:hypothetical protein